MLYRSLKVTRLATIRTLIAIRFKEFNRCEINSTYQSIVNPEISTKNRQKYKMSLLSQGVHGRPVKICISIEKFTRQPICSSCTFQTPGVLLGFSFSTHQQMFAFMYLIFILNTVVKQCQKWSIEKPKYLFDVISSRER